MFTQRSLSLGSAAAPSHMRSSCRSRRHGTHRQPIARCSVSVVASAMKTSVVGSTCGGFDMWWVRHVVGSTCGGFDMWWVRHVVGSTWCQSAMIGVPSRRCVSITLASMSIWCSRASSGHVVRTATRHRHTLVDRSRPDTWICPAERVFVVSDANSVRRRGAVRTRPGCRRRCRERNRDPRPRAWRGRHCR
jgi:hypothetical protein